MSEHEPGIDPGDQDPSLIRKLPPFQELEELYGPAFEQVVEGLEATAAGEAEMNRTIALIMGLGSHQALGRQRALKAYREAEQTQLHGMGFHVVYAFGLKHMALAVHNREAESTFDRAMQVFWQDHLKPITADEPRIEEELLFYSEVAEMLAVNEVGRESLTRTDNAVVSAANRLVRGAAERVYSGFRYSHASEVEAAVRSLDFNHPHRAVTREFVSRFDPNFIRDLESKA